MPKKTFLFQIDDPKVRSLYINHTTAYTDDCGIDLYIADDDIIEPCSSKLIDLKIKCQCVSESLDETQVKIRELELKLNKLDSNSDYCNEEMINPSESQLKYYSYLLVPRSSISKTTLILKNSIGIIDAGYLQTLKCAFYNYGSEPVKLKKGERYVQLISRSDDLINCKIVEKLRDNSDRGNSLGFGSSGK